MALRDHAAAVSPSCFFGSTLSFARSSSLSHGELPAGLAGGVWPFSWSSVQFSDPFGTPGLWRGFRSGAPTHPGLLLCWRSQGRMFSLGAWDTARCGLWPDLPRSIGLRADLGKALDRRRRTSLRYQVAQVWPLKLGKPRKPTNGEFRAHYRQPNQRIGQIAPVEQWVILSLCGANAESKLRGPRERDAPTEVPTIRA